MPPSLDCKPHTNGEELCLPSSQLSSSSLARRWIQSRNSIKMEWIKKVTNCGPIVCGEGKKVSSGVSGGLPILLIPFLEFWASGGRGQATPPFGLSVHQ